MNIVTTVARIWPSLRIVIYTGMAAVFGALTLFDVMSDEQSASLLGGIDTALGALAFLLAAFYTPGGAKVPAPKVVINAPAPVTVDTGAGISAHDVSAAIEHIDGLVKSGAVTAGQLRARLEQRLGNR